MGVTEPSVSVEDELEAWTSPSGALPDPLFAASRCLFPSLQGLEGEAFGLPLGSIPFPTAPFFPSVILVGELNALLATADLMPILLTFSEGISKTLFSLVSATSFTFCLTELPVRLLHLPDVRGGGGGGGGGVGVGGGVGT